jgi:cyclopropane fatty-acyl-phospholipid synthase-like methyltransferase
MKPFAESCEQNKQPILTVLQRLFSEPGTVLEIGSGTGQHAIWFGRHLPHLTWQTSDLSDNHAGIAQWLAEEGLSNVLPPLDLDVREGFPLHSRYDYVFSANSLHIMHWHAVEAFFCLVGNSLVKNGLLAVYGPFNYHGQYTSDSNARFDAWLKQRDPGSGIRDLDDLQRLATQNGLQLVDDIEMPANNRILVWKKIAA